MSSPSELRYTPEHEWARQEDDGSITIGITNHAQDALGDVVFVELPEAGDSFDAEEKFGVVESVKTVSDLYSPCSGDVMAVNSDLESAPEAVNEDPYGAGWIIRLKPSDQAQVDALMTAAQYDAFVAEQG
jgi:glycine cleavage system H protein